MEKNTIKDHCDGHTCACFDETGKKLVTCGFDGLLRITNIFDGTVEFTGQIEEKLLAVAIKDDRIFVATGKNSVEAYTFPDMDHDEVILRFRASVNDIDVTKYGNYLLAGSSDCSMKLMDLVDNTVTAFQGHNAPVLSVALDPMNEFVVSASCDATVKIWQISSKNCVKTLYNILPECSDFNNAETLCRLHWQPISGKLLAVPQKETIQIYERNSWNKLYIFKDASVNEYVNIARFSTCGEYIAAASINGTVLIWKTASRKLIEKREHLKLASICSLVWNPSGKAEIAFCDKKGKLTVLDNIQTSELETPNMKNTKRSSATISSEGDDDDDDEDENTFSIEKIKASTFPRHLQDNDDLPILTHKSRISLSLPTIGNDQNLEDDFDDDLTIGVGKSVANGDFQKPFQPASTPCHLKRRYLVWNYIGMIRSYNTEEENTVEIDFHNTAIHSAIFFENVFGHTMGSLSNSAAVLACGSRENQRSKLLCLHYSSWDSNKEWSVDMPVGETIQGVAVGEEWVAVVTDAQNVRIFTISGLQREVFVLPGPMVSMSGYSKYLVVVYHRGVGLPGSQCLRGLLVTVDRDKLGKLSIDIPLPKQSQLSWIGFTDEGTACIVDTLGNVSLLVKRGIGSVWTVVCNMMRQVKRTSNHCFVVSVSERKQQIRYLLCKGSKYPAILPRPGQLMMPFQLSLTDLNTEKGQLEDSYWRNKLLCDTTAKLDAEGFDTSDVKDLAAKTCRKSLLKLFALSCNEDLEFRACDYFDMMDYDTAHLAEKYANKLNKYELLEKLEEQLKGKGNPENEENYNIPSVRLANDEVLRSENEIYEEKLQICSLRKENMKLNASSDDYGNNEAETENFHADNNIEVDLPQSSCSSGTPNISQTSKQFVNPFKVVAENAQKTKPKGLEFFNSLEKMDTKQKKKQLQMADLTKKQTGKRKTVSTSVPSAKSMKQSMLPFNSKAAKLAEISNSIEDSNIEEAIKECEDPKETETEGKGISANKRQKLVDNSAAHNKLASFAFSE